jgi:hypothetical protein
MNWLSRGPRDGSRTFVSWTIAFGLAASLHACAPDHPARRALDTSVDGASAAPAPNPKGAADGTRCANGMDCRSGACVDGFCCQSACAGPCVSCDQPGAEGRCQPTADGEDPTADCQEDPPATCNLDGACDGRGACRRWRAGTICAPGGCRDATEKAANTCDGAGHCLTGGSRSCAPAVCVGESCGAPCTTRDDCQMGFFCDASTCRAQRDQGAACTVDAQCTTGHCADGVCCATACTEKCQVCNNQGAVGTCTPVRDGFDPKRQCLVQAAYTCGNAGGCDGKGGCKLHVAGTYCGPATCSGFTLLATSACDGLGLCKPGPGRDCSPYVCNGNVDCWTACATSDQCRPGRTCRINRCE